MGESLDLSAVRAAVPAPWSEPALLLDRFVLNGPAFAAWCGEHFGIRTRCDAQLFITELCPLRELVMIDADLTGQPVAYRIPACCYTPILKEAVV